jgi:hypothetical protein
MHQEAMEDDKNSPKYAKLLAEYSKVSYQLDCNYLINLIFFSKSSAASTSKSTEKCCSGGEKQVIWPARVNEN